jgi:hypothetical protein
VRWGKYKDVPAVASELLLLATALPRRELSRTAGMDIEEDKAKNGETMGFQMPLFACGPYISFHP